MNLCDDSVDEEDQETGILDVRDSSIQQEKHIVRDLNTLPIRDFADFKSQQVSLSDL